jgi:DNA-damage-inducible protein J
MTATVQARIDEQVRDEASKVLERWGLSVSDAVRILLTRTAREGRLPIELLSTSPEHDSWFRGQVSLALSDEQEINDDTVEREFAHRRAKARVAGDRDHAGKRAK